MSETMSPAPPPRGRAILYVILIFVAGAVFGSALTLGVGRHVLQQRPRDPAGWDVDAMRRLDRHLDLTAEQQARIEPVLQDMAERIRDVRMTSRRQWLSIIQEARGRIRHELTPEQQVEFDKLATRARANLGRWLDAPGAGRPRHNRPEP